MGGGGSKCQQKVLVIGLDNAGKSTFLNFLKPAKQQSETVPTVGFSCETFNYKKVQVTAFDMSGQSRYRSLWEHYITDVAGIIFVIDSTDAVRFEVAKQELKWVLDQLNKPSADHGGVTNCTFLVLANKMDLPKAKHPQELIGTLDLSSLMGPRTWQMYATNCIRGAGVTEAMDWFTKALKTMPN